MAEAIQVATYVVSEDSEGETKGPMGAKIETKVTTSLTRHRRGEVIVEAM